MAEENQTYELTVSGNGAIMPRDFQGYWKLCVELSRSQFVPDTFRGKPHDILAAHQFGSDLGLSLMQSLSSVAVVNGKPTVYGDATLGIILQSGECSDLQQYWEIDGERYDDLLKLSDNLAEWPDNLTAVCLIARKGIETPKIGRFSVKDAKRIGKWNKTTSTGKATVWMTAPKDMLMWRATHRAERIFADYLKGMVIREVAEDYSDNQEPAPAPESNVVDVKPEDVITNRSIVMDKASEWDSFNEDALSAFIKELSEFHKMSGEEICAQILENMDTFEDAFVAWKKENFVANVPESEDVPVQENDDEQETEDEPPAEETEEDPEATVSDQSAVSYEQQVGDLIERIMVFTDQHNIKPVRDVAEALSEYAEYTGGSADLTKGQIIQTMYENGSQYFDHFYRWCERNSYLEGMKKKEPEAPVEKEDPPAEKEAPSADGKNEMGQYLTMKTHLISSIYQYMADKGEGRVINAAAEKFDMYVDAVAENAGMRQDKVLEAFKEEGPSWIEGFFNYLNMIEKEEKVPTPPGDQTIPPEEKPDPPAPKKSTGVSEFRKKWYKKKSGDTLKEYVTKNWDEVLEGCRANVDDYKALCKKWKKFVPGEPCPVTQEQLDLPSIEGDSNAGEEVAGAPEPSDEVPVTNNVEKPEGDKAQDNNSESAGEKPTLESDHGKFYSYLQKKYPDDFRVVNKTLKFGLSGISKAGVQITAMRLAERLGLNIENL